jgi:mono/diheme cytochrome c family protein
MIGHRDVTRRVAHGAILALVFCAAAEAAPPSIPLPEGNPKRGRTVFRRARCATCHVVTGSSFSSGLDEPLMQIRLGGPDADRLDDTALATEIILPSHRVTVQGVSGHWSVAADSPMPSFARALSVQDVADLVAFLRPIYDMRPDRPGGGGGQR